MSLSIQSKNTIARDLAVVGCGAITQAFYLPVIARHRSMFGQVWLVDPSDHALAAAASIVPAQRVHQLADVNGPLQMAIIATPNQHHFSVASEAIARGAHVLVEKPFVIWPDEGRKLLQAASLKARLIAVNQTRRFFPLASALRRQLHTGELGRLTSIVHREGTKLSWPFESGAGFMQGAVRTGVVMDFGVHVIDFYHYLLRPKWKLVSAIHDGFRGPEGLAEIELQADDAPVSIRLSRYTPQENVGRLVFERGEVWFNVHDPKTYSVRTASARARTLPTENGVACGTQAERVMLNFLDACEKPQSAVCDATSSLPVIDILDEIYRRGRLYPTEIGTV